MTMMMATIQTCTYSTCNIEFAKKYALGTAVRGVDHIDAFDPEKDARQFAQLMSLCNGLVICD